MNNENTIVESTPLLRAKLALSEIGRDKGNVEHARKERQDFVYQTVLKECTNERDRNRGSEVKSLNGGNSIMV